MCTRNILFVVVLISVVVFPLIFVWVEPTDVAVCWTTGARFSGGGRGNAECRASSRLPSVTIGKDIPETEHNYKSSFRMPPTFSFCIFLPKKYVEKVKLRFECPQSLDQTSITGQECFIR